MLGKPHTNNKHHGIIKIRAQIYPRRKVLTRVRICGLRLKQLANEIETGFSLLSNGNKKLLNS